MAAIHNRRRGPDAIAKMVTFTSVASWLLIILAFVIYQLTHPMGSSYNSIRQTMIDFSAGVIISKVLLMLNVLFCIWGMVMNLMRNKRKTDRFHISLVVSAAISLGGFILMMMFL